MYLHFKKKVVPILQFEMTGHKDEREYYEILSGESKFGESPPVVRRKIVKVI